MGEAISAVAAPPRPAVALAADGVLRVADMDPALWAKAPHLRQALLESGVDVLPRPTGWHVLVQQYIRPERSAGGIVFAEVTKKEDQWQGRVGLVLALGLDSYVDEHKFPSRSWVRTGDWVMWSALETAATRFKCGAAVLAIIPDDKLIAVGVNPAIVVGA